MHNNNNNNNNNINTNNNSNNNKNITYAQQYVSYHRGMVLGNKVFFYT